jgi:glucarate dehydratase
MPCLLYGKLLALMYHFVLIRCIWEVETAIKYGKKMEGLIEYLEDPVRGQENMAKVRKQVKIPLATNMCTTSLKIYPVA